MRAEADIEFVPNEKGDAYEPPRSAAKIATKLPLLNLISGVSLRRTTAELSSSYRSLRLDVIYER